MHVSIERFSAFVEDQRDVRDVREIQPMDVQAFVDARRADGSRAMERTRHARLKAVRLAFRVGYRIGIVIPEPSAGVAVGTLTSVRARPLTDEEIALGRRHAVTSLADFRRSLAWALAEATARTGEIGRVHVADVDMDAGTVFLPGTRGVDERLGELTGWGQDQLRRRMRAADPEEPLIVWRRHPSQLTAASSEAVRETLKVAGLIGPGVRPVSIAAWIGVRLLGRGAPIHVVARRLGMRSLDDTARLLRFDWRSAT